MTTDPSPASQRTGTGPEARGFDTAKGRRLRAVDLDFVEQAPVTHTLHLEVQASPTRLYAALCDSPATWTWMPMVRGGSWLGEGRGVGARRAIRVGPARITETVLAAEDGVRWAYRVDWTSLPLAAALIEDWQLTEVPATATRPVHTEVAYAFCIEPLRGTGVLTRSAGFGLAQVARRVEANLNRLLAPADGLATT